jgi:hypothetical protein
MNPTIGGRKLRPPILTRWVCAILHFAFTEQGVAMLSSILNSDIAIQVNIKIIRIFSKMKEALLAHKDILLAIEKLEKDVTQNKQDIALIFEALKQLLNPTQQERRMIGFKSNG